MSFILSVIVPMHNEEEVLEHFFSTLTPILKNITPNYEIICINDGSTDDTARKLTAFQKKDAAIKIISFSRNFGKEAALTAGLEYSSGDAVIPIDVDLQDPPEVIPELVKEWQNGHKVVLATRKKRHDSFFKRHTAALFYKVLGSVTNVRIPANTGDFRLMDKQVVKAILQMPERTRFMKGVFAWAGFKTTSVYYERPERTQGISKWNFIKLWSFALDGIFSFTTLPLKIWTYLGALISLFAFSYASFLILRTILFGVDVPGYASIMTAVLFMGGIQLISLGIMGEYIGRIYRETKQRPIYIIESKEGFGDE